MRILWSSNALWAHTGYGIQAKYLLPRFQKMGHEVAQFAWYGLQGAKLKLNGMMIYPKAFDPWGNDVIGAHAADFKADLVISLQDIWVLPDDYRELVGRPWACWFPVDMKPVPPKVADMAKRADYPITYSRFGTEEMRKAGVECHYIPHGVDCNVFRPKDRQECRKRFDIEPDTFFVAMVGANKGFPSRKGFPEALQAFKLFHDKHPDSMLYMHTTETDIKGGVNFDALIQGIEGFPKDAIRFVDQYAYLGGLPEEYLADVYNSADVLLQPSYGEGFGIPIIEAQACGCPVLVNDCTSMTELVFSGKAIKPLQKFFTPLGGWISIPDINAFVEGLEWAHGMANGEQAQEWTREKARQGALAYDWDTVVAEYWRPFLEMAEAEIRPDHEHVWATTGLYNDRKELCVPCKVPGCPAERRQLPSGKTMDYPHGFATAINGIALDIEDDPEGGVAKVIMREIDKSYKPDDIAFEDGDVVIDIGAHVGIVGIYLAKRYPFLKVYAYEPDKENYKRLVRNIEANEVAVMAVNKAVTGDGRLVSMGGDRASNSGGRSIYTETQETEPIESVTLADIFTAREIDRCRLLKIDCEGAEYEVLEAGESLLDRVDHLRGEFHINGTTARQENADELIALCERHIQDVRVTKCQL